MCTIKQHVIHIFLACCAVILSNGLKSDQLRK
ncbi:hypothetical protein CKO_02004 [Citrobacter koseri ATCC BAA-895]|uniref:Uncharacterized protein n=1 Tax=Citrobacter koseri (strain ATCC BAA-895 / CDC 4225-83 / SGSC4696) TaxID=290338 RepID=A8AI17_CITK8|nr:hypothetical protein CKO_02004 [Citrobacter koseri ATCC BAA-895]